MASYDKYYKKENYFGNSYEGVLNFFNTLDNKGTLCDLGAGQGRDSIPLSKMGFKVTAVDISKVGLNQIKAKDKDNSIKCVIADIYTYPLGFFDFIFMNSILHFYKNDLEKEKSFVINICKEMKIGGIFANCINKSENAENQFKKAIKSSGIPFKVLHEEYVHYEEFEMDYHFYVIEKM